MGQLFLGDAAGLPQLFHVLAKVGFCCHAAMVRIVSSRLQVL